MHWIPVILIFPYFFFLFKIYIGLTKIKSFYASNGPTISVSVIVACRNEQNNLPNLLKCIAEQEFPVELLEVIIVDDNSTDNTFKIASGFTGKNNLIAVKNKGTGKKQAIRTGINSSSGQLIITTDADCRMGKRWIKTIASFYENKRPEMIICPVQIEPLPGFFGGFQELEFLSLQGITAGTAVSGEATMCNGANLAFSRKAYVDHSDDLHDELASGDDIFLLQSLKKQTHSNILWLESPDATVTAASSLTIRAFLKQRRRWVSKVKAYNDKFTILLGIVTIVTIILLVSILIAGLFNSVFLLEFLLIFILKSVPDFLIIKNTSVRYGKRKLMKWFLPAEFVYSFYVLCVAVYSLISCEKRVNLIPHF